MLLFELMYMLLHCQIRCLYICVYMCVVVGVGFQVGKYMHSLNQSAADHTCPDANSSSCFIELSLVQVKSAAHSIETFP